MKFSVAVRVPLAFGANVMFAVQLAFAARLDVQVLEKILKSPGSAPDTVMLLIVIALLPPLARVTVFCAPTPPTETEAQLRLVGETVAAEANPARARKNAENKATRNRRGDLKRGDVFLFVC